MSIRDRSRTGHEPEWQHEFATREEWTAFVGEKYFKNLEPGMPFLLVSRLLRHDSGGRSSPATWMDISYCVGLLENDGPLFGHIEAMGGFSSNPGSFVGAREYVCYPEAWIKGNRTSDVSGRLEIPHNHYFHYTPVTKGFIPPFDMGRPHDLFDKEVEAFSVACGVYAMEALAAEETGWNKKFLPWYVRAITKLVIPSESAFVHDVVHQERVAVISRLRNLHRTVLEHEARIRSVNGSIGVPLIQNGALSIITDQAFANLMTHGNRTEIEQQISLIQRNLVVAEELGMTTCRDLIEVDGFRCQPAVVIEDFRRLYAIE